MTCHSIPLALLLTTDSVPLGHRSTRIGQVIICRNSFADLLPGLQELFSAAVALGCLYHLCPLAQVTGLPGTNHHDKTSGLRPVLVAIHTHTHTHTHTNDIPLPDVLATPLVGLSHCQLHLVHSGLKPGAKLILYPVDASGKQLLHYPWESPAAVPPPTEPTWLCLLVLVQGLIQVKGHSLSLLAWQVSLQPPEEGM